MTKQEAQERKLYDERPGASGGLWDGTGKRWGVFGSDQWDGIVADYDTHGEAMAHLRRSAEMEPWRGTRHVIKDDCLFVESVHAGSASSHLDSWVEEILPEGEL